MGDYILNEESNTQMKASIFRRTCVPFIASSLPNPPKKRIVSIAMWKSTHTSFLRSLDMGLRGLIGGGLDLGGQKLRY